MAFLKKLGLTSLLVGVCYIGYQVLMEKQAERQKKLVAEQSQQPTKKLPAVKEEKPIISSHGSWQYNEQRGTIFTVTPIGKDVSGWDTFLVLELSQDEVFLSALVTIEEYKKWRTLNPAPHIEYKGKKLVKHTDFFQRGEAITLEAPDKKLVNLYPSHENDFQVSANYNYRLTPFLIPYLKKGEVLKATGNMATQSKPSFVLNGFSKMYEHDIDGKKPIAWRYNFFPRHLKCEQVGSRKYIWLDSPNGYYALNGQALSAIKQGKAPQGALIGRDYIGRKTLKDLIKRGSELCR